MPDVPETPEQAKQSLLQNAKKWGENSFPPTLLATLITAQSLQPFRLVPMLFPPVLLFSSYLNLQGYKKDSAGIAGAWSAAYLLLALRRRQKLSNKIKLGGIVRGATLGLAAVNAVSGGYAYFGGKRDEVDL